jgi:hypothetical protein
VNVPSALHHLFWDCRPETIDTEAHAPFVLERVLEYGSLGDVRWALGTYGAERLKAFLRERGVRTLSRKTLSFWTLQLGLEGEACFERSSLTRSRPFWNY